MATKTDIQAAAAIDLISDIVSTMNRGAALGILAKHERALSAIGGTVVLGQPSMEYQKAKIIVGALRTALEM